MPQTHPQTQRSTQQATLASGASEAHEDESQGVQGTHRHHAPGSRDRSCAHSNQWLTGCDLPTDAGGEGR